MGGSIKTRTVLEGQGGSIKIRPLSERREEGVYDIYGRLVFPFFPVANILAWQWRFLGESYYIYRS